MFFRRKAPQKLTFSDYIERARRAAFITETTPASPGRVRVIRKGVAAVLEDGGDSPPRVIERAGLLMGQEIASLVDAGYQKLFATPSGKRKPALAEDLKAVHEFQEELREALGLVSLYNESLGTVSNLYLYDRVVDRDAGVPKRAWE